MTDAPIFVGGAARSGTTLVRVLLDSHPRICCGRELKIMGLLLQQRHETKTVQAAIEDAQRVTPEEADRLYRNLILGLLEPYRAEQGKPRIAEKSPDNVFLFALIAELFPDSQIVHVIRDGRDVVASLQHQRWADAETGEPVKVTRDVVEAARYWDQAVAIGRGIGATLGDRYLELRYEDLVKDPQGECKRLFTALGEEWDPVVLLGQRRIRTDEPNAYEAAKPINAGAVGRYKQDLTPEQLRTVEAEIGPHLASLGYA